MSRRRGFEIRALGEIAIRCAGMGAMVDFYGDVLGLPLLSGGRDADITFFTLGDGYAGHTAVLALFRHDAGREDIHPRANVPPLTGGRSSLHHIALTVSRSDQDAVVAWYDALGRDYRVQEFGWIGWRGIFTTDPEGNTVELVAYDPAVKEA